MLRLIGRAIALIPHKVKELLVEHGVRLTRIPSSTELTHAVVNTLTSGRKQFKYRFSELLLQFDHYDQKQVEEDQFDPSMLLSAVGPLSDGITGIFASRNDRMAIEADAKAQIELANAQARSSFRNQLVQLKAQAEHSRAASIMRQEKTKVITIAAVAGVTCVGLFFGLRRMRPKRTPPITTKTPPIATA